MKRIWLCLALAAPMSALAACSSDDPEPAPAPVDPVDPTPDAGPQEDASPPPPDPADAGPRACGDASDSPPRVLLVQGSLGDIEGSELAVVNLESKTVDGRLQFPGGYGLTSSLGTDPYLLDEENDDVIRLDAREPWKPVAKWNVRGDDPAPGGDPNANPVAVVQTSCSKAYVLRYNRDRIAIIDPSQPEGGAPTGYIDLAPLKQPGDPTMIEMTSAVYVPEKKRIYVLLGNVDFTRYDATNMALICAPELKPSIIAIDVETDEVVSLGGSAPGGGIALEGYNPILGAPLVYDAALNRLVVLHGGCNEAAEGGVGDVARRGVEAVDLATGTTTTLLALGNDFPSSLAYVSGERAALAFFFAGYRWDPRQPTLGAPIEGGMDVIAVDGRGAFVGTRQLYGEGGAPGSLEVVAVPNGDDAPSVVLEDPFSRPGGYVAGVEAWPKR